MYSHLLNQLTYIKRAFQIYQHPSAINSLENVNSMNSCCVSLMALKQCLVDPRGNDYSTLIHLCLQWLQLQNKLRVAACLQKDMINCSVNVDEFPLFSSLINLSFSPSSYHVKSCIHDLHIRNCESRDNARTYTYINMDVCILPERLLAILWGAANVLDFEECRNAGSLNSGV